MTEFSVEQAAGELGLTPVGLPGIVIRSADSLAEAGAGSVAWSKTLSGDNAVLLDRLSGAVLVLPVPADAAQEEAVRGWGLRNAILLADNPRLAFARILDRHFLDQGLTLAPGVDPSARVDPTARLGNDVTIGAGCFVGAGVDIGDGTILHPGAVVHSGTVIGRGCILQSNCVIGSRGFGFVRNEQGVWEHFPQVGRVLIEDDVEIGACTCVDRPGLGATRILHGSKVDNLCHIAHNVVIGPNAVIVACAELGAGVVVGEGAWLGPNSCCMQNVTFGKDSFVGIGATVLKDVPDGVVVAGNPAEPMSFVRALRRVLRRLVDSEP